jgi:hypothetical protein
MTTRGRTSKVATPWGRAALVDEVELEQEAGERRFGVLVQLLEAEGGEELLRVAYTTGGTARRGPVTLRTSEVKALRKLLARKPRLAAALAGAGGGAKRTS